MFLAVLLFCFRYQAVPDRVFAYIKVDVEETCFFRKVFSTASVSHSPIAVFPPICGPCVAGSAFVCTLLSDDSQL